MYFIDVFYRSETLPANLIQVRTSFPNLKPTILLYFAHMIILDTLWSILIQSQDWIELKLIQSLDWIKINSPHFARTCPVLIVGFEIVLQVFSILHEDLKWFSLIWGGQKALAGLQGTNWFFQGLGLGQLAQERTNQTLFTCVYALLSMTLKSAL
jgi:hypothetical protein